MTPAEAAQLLEAFETRHNADNLDKLHHAYIWTCIQMWLMSHYKAKDFPTPGQVPAIVEESLNVNYQLWCARGDGADTTALENRLDQLHQALAELASEVLAENGLPESWTEGWRR